MLVTLLSLPARFFLRPIVRTFNCHTHLTHSYLLNKEQSPNCDHCRSPLTHINIRESAVKHEPTNHNDAHYATTEKQLWL